MASSSSPPSRSSIFNHHHPQFRLAFLALLAVALLSFCIALLAFASALSRPHPPPRVPSRTLAAGKADLQSSNNNFNLKRSEDVEFRDGSFIHERVQLELSRFSDYVKLPGANKVHYPKAKNTMPKPK